MCYVCLSSSLLIFPATSAWSAIFQPQSDEGVIEIGAEILASEKTDGPSAKTEEIIGKFKTVAEKTIVVYGVEHLKPIPTGYLYDNVKVIFGKTEAEIPFMDIVMAIASSMISPEGKWKGYKATMIVVE